MDMNSNSSKMPFLAEPLSGKNVKSLAYSCFKDRLPVIITKVIDLLCRDWKNLSQERDAGDEASAVAGKLSKLKYEIQTDKDISALEDDFEDAPIWNALIAAHIENASTVKPSYFSLPWLFGECYVYRRIFSAFLATKSLCDFDPFADSKAEALSSSAGAVLSLLKHLATIVDDEADVDHLKSRCRRLWRICLWGNRCDLSVSAGECNSQDSNPLESVDTLEANILVDHFDSAWAAIGGTDEASVSDQRRSPRHLEWVLDNSGFELLSDLVMADYLTSKGLVLSVRFRAKRIPWLVSDVTTRDFQYLLNWLTSSDDKVAVDFGAKVRRYFTDGIWTVADDIFWTLPHDYAAMEANSPELYAELSSAALIIFKGDLNYRKLVGDRQWHPETPFGDSLRGFHPAPLVSIRTIKADVISGLAPGVAESLDQKWGSNAWMLGGDYGVIQFFG